MAAVAAVAATVMAAAASKGHGAVGQRPAPVLWGERFSKSFDECLVGVFLRGRKRAAPAAVHQDTPFCLHEKD